MRFRSFGYINTSTLIWTANRITMFLDRINPVKAIKREAHQEYQIIPRNKKHSHRCSAMAKEIQHSHKRTESHGSFFPEGGIATLMFN